MFICLDPMFFVGGFNYNEPYSVNIINHNHISYIFMYHHLSLYFANYILSLRYKNLHFFEKIPKKGGDFQRFPGQH